ncbi:ATP-binding protein [Rhizobium sp. LjRoot98]|uniref:sensor histidine kinase n=1 Tax=unclassified Rhizobium TaxID=2613769 RepID=UPI000AF579FF|nr:MULTISPECIES: ATP-binding protein [unclassified Rhizobium]
MANLDGYSNDMIWRHLPLRNLTVALFVWLGLTVLFAGVSMRIEYQRASEELAATGQTIHRLISQRAAQHDAHLTSLVALIKAAPELPETAIGEVFQSIVQFYPRITAIDLVRLPVDGVSTAATLISWPGPLKTDLSPIASAIAGQKQGEVRTYLNTAYPGRYLLGKRATAGNPGLAIVVQIDPVLLIEGDERPAWAHVRVSLDGETVLDREANGPSVTDSILTQPHFSKIVDSQSQPFMVDATRPLALSDILSGTRIGGFALACLAVLLLLLFTWQLKANARKLQQTAEEAERRAHLHEHETRLAHALRVNALGELASGIAHELTQPLTALLSQSQAALRLAASEHPDPALLPEALSANVREAKRAGAMLKRMRDYISKREQKLVLADLNQIVVDIAELVRADLEKRQITLILDLATPSPQAVVDPIEMEQVLHNLVRNAADALEHGDMPDRSIRIETILLESGAIIQVSDTGPGIEADTLPRLFEPFYTTKTDGMGLGLALCASLVERIGGHIDGRNQTSGGAIFTVTLPAVEQHLKAAQ